jgi:hypothetical protein
MKRERGRERRKGSKRESEREGERERERESETKSHMADSIFSSWSHIGLPSRRQQGSRCPHEQDEA